MSVNKNALIRYQALDRCFRNPGRIYFWEDLLEECNKSLLEFDPTSSGIQRRQLFADINFMESEQGWSIPLERIPYDKKKYYRYEDLSFSINNQPLNKSEAAKIQSALQILSRFSGTPQFEWINEMIPMLETKFGLVQKKTEAMNFESNFDLKGVNFLPPLFDAIINERVLVVKYKDFKNEEPYTIIFHPYHLKQYNSRWFAFGLNEELHISTWNLALDRIEEIKESSGTYVNSTTDWEDYFYDIIGVSRPVNSVVEEIKMLFSFENAPYAITKPLHPTQKHKYVDNGLEVRISVIPNYELEKLILSYGKEVEVLAPSHLRKKIGNLLKTVVKRYV